MPLHLHSVTPCSSPVAAGPSTCPLSLSGHLQMSSPEPGRQLPACPLCLTIPGSRQQHIHSPVMALHTDLTTARLLQCQADPAMLLSAWLAPRISIESSQDASQCTCGQLMHPIILYPMLYAMRVSSHNSVSNTQCAMQLTLCLPHTHTPTCCLSATAPQN